MFWMFIDDWTYKFGEWKHVLHKGSHDSWPNRAPGIWLHPRDNNLRIYMNTFSSIDEFVDVIGVPVSEWIHIAVRVKGRKMDVLVNGIIKTSHEFGDTLKQNYGDLYINRLGGFGGYMSRIRYYNKAIGFRELESLLKQGPASSPC
mgnify:CR=1 FL=1